MNTSEDIDNKINEVALDNANALEESMPHIPVEEKVGDSKRKAFPSRRGRGQPNSKANN